MSSKIKPSRKQILKKRLNDFQICQNDQKSEPLLFVSNKCLKQIELFRLLSTKFSVLFFLHLCFFGHRQLKKNVSF